MLEAHSLSMVKVIYERLYYIQPKSVKGKYLCHYLRKCES